MLLALYLRVYTDIKEQIQTITTITTITITTIAITTPGRGFNISNGWKGFFYFANVHKYSDDILLNCFGGVIWRGVGGC
jgi:hypothetical protein